MKKRLMLIFSVFIIVVLFYTAGFYKEYEKRCDYFCYYFSGQVDSIHFSPQNLKAVLINDTWVPLGLNISYEINIEIGDSIVKSKHSYSTMLIKENAVYDITTLRNEKILTKICDCEEEYPE